MSRDTLLILYHIYGSKTSDFVQCINNFFKLFSLYLNTISIDDNPTRVQIFLGKFTQLLFPDTKISGSRCSGHRRVAVFPLLRSHSMEQAAPVPDRTSVHSAGAQTGMSGNGKHSRCLLLPSPPWCMPWHSPLLRPAYRRTAILFFRLQMDGCCSRLVTLELVKYPRNDVPAEVLKTLMPWSEELPDHCRKTKSR